MEWDQKGLGRLLVTSEAASPVDSFCTQPRWCPSLVLTALGPLSNALNARNSFWALQVPVTPGSLEIKPELSKELLETKPPPPPRLPLLPPDGPILGRQKG